MDTIYNTIYLSENGKKWQSRAFYKFKIADNKLISVFGFVHQPDVTVCDVTTTGNNLYGTNENNEMVVIAHLDDVATDKLVISGFMSLKK